MMARAPPRTWDAALQSFSPTAISPVATGEFMIAIATEDLVA
jgi:hypothetical protein